MANNKQHDNFGVSPYDQRAIQALGPRPGTRRGDAGATSKQVPIEQTKPGRAYQGASGSSKRSK